jgi:Ca-activated chloride channel family protein
VLVAFDPAQLADARQRVLKLADGLQASGGTAIYAALQRAQALARDELQREPGRYVSIVLLTDGENTTGPGFAEFSKTQAAGDAVRVFPVLFGEASSGEMAELANLTGGRVFDGRKASLALVFKEIRGYQ